MVGFVLFVRKSLVKPLNQLTNTAKDLAEGEGDLTKKLHLDREDEIGMAAKYFNAFIEKVRQIIVKAKEAAGRNVAIATDLKSTAERVKTRIEEEKQMINRTAETAESIAKPLEEFEKLVATSEREVAEAAKRLSSTMESVKKLQETVERTEVESKASVEALKNLDREAEHISNIIEIIEDIADKTNLLALNASIEAAKAGEAGKGFAVVADEIRKLAEQIQKNTINIRDVLKEIVHSISETTQQIEKSTYENVGFLRSVSGSVIGEMEEVTQVMQKTSGISKNVKERANKLVKEVESIIEDIRKIDSISSENAENVSKMLSKIKELYLEIEELNKIKDFKESPLTIDKKLYLLKGDTTTPIESHTILKVGDKIKVQLRVKTDRAMEYIMLKDSRASAFEPTNILSQYRWQNSLGYYESTKDNATYFFIDRLKRGTYIFEYTLFVTHRGSFSNSIATIESMYAPEFKSHSKGEQINVK